MAAESTLAGLSELRAAVDTLLTADPSTLRGTELAAALCELETQRRRLESIDQRVLAEVAEQGVAGEYARYSPADLLVTLLRVTPTEAKARVARACDLGPRRAMTGEPLPPILPATSVAVAAGEISPAHVRVITTCMDELPPTIDPDVSELAESLLVEAARHEHPGQLAKTAALLVARLDPDGLEPKEARLERMRGFSLLKRRDGSSVPTGTAHPGGDGAVGDDSRRAGRAGAGRRRAA
jgi:hypothetical protein